MRKIAFPAFAAFLLTTAAAWAAEDEAKSENSGMPEDRIELIKVDIDLRRTSLSPALDEAVGLTSSGTRS
jgi:hypothetical protein